MNATVCVCTSGAVAVHVTVESQTEAPIHVSWEIFGISEIVILCICWCSYTTVCIQIFITVFSWSTVRYSGELDSSISQLYHLYFGYCCCCSTLSDEDSVVAVIEEWRREGLQDCIEVNFRWKSHTPTYTLFQWHSQNLMVLGLEDFCLPRRLGAELLVRGFWAPLQLKAFQFFDATRSAKMFPFIYFAMHV